MTVHTHLHDELAQNPSRVTIDTVFGPVTGGRATNGAAVFLGEMLTLYCQWNTTWPLLLEIPYALPPRRFEDPIGLPKSFRYDAKEYIREATCECAPKNHLKDWSYRRGNTPSIIRCGSTYEWWSSRRWKPSGIFYASRSSEPFLKVPRLRTKLDTEKYLKIRSWSSYLELRVHAD